jgi:hypothetical protein
VDVIGAAITDVASHGVVATMSVRSIVRDNLCITKSPNISAATFGEAVVFVKKTNDDPGRAPRN